MDVGSRKDEDRSLEDKPIHSQNGNEVRFIVFCKRNCGKTTKHISKLCADHRKDWVNGYNQALKDIVKENGNGKR